MPKTPKKTRKRKRNPTTKSRKVTGTLRKGVTNPDRRDREYLTPKEVLKLRKGAESVGRHGTRDGLIILMLYLHGLRVSELANMKWTDIRLDAGQIHVRRLKGSTDSIHDLRGDELRTLRKVKRAYPDSPYVFTTERSTQITGSAIQKLVRRAGIVSGLESKVGIIHPHMLRHSTGYALANRGVDTRTIMHYLGHKNIQHVVRYTALSTERLRNILPEGG